MPEPFRKANSFCKFGSVNGALLGTPTEIKQREGDVFEHGQLRDEVETLKHKPEMSEADLAQPVVIELADVLIGDCLLYTSPSPRDRTRPRMPSSA